MEETTTQPAGWYQNPEGTGQRYWDGAAWTDQARESMPTEERKAVLAERIAKLVPLGFRVESQTDFQAVMVKGHRPNHLLHFFIGLATLSLWWWFVWLPIVIFGGEKHRVVSVDANGQVAETKTPR